MKVELNETECEEIVRKATRQENVKVVKFEIENFGNYLGFLGEYFRLKIIACVNGKTDEFKFFMKSLPTYDLKQRKMLIETGIFRKEVKLYEKLLRDLSELSGNEKSWCPAAFFTRDDLLVLDDLSLKGFRILPFQYNFNQAQVETTLKSLASFHCSSIVYEHEGRKSISDEFSELLFETSVDDISWYHSGLKAVFDIALHRTKHRNIIKSDFYEKIFQSIDNMESAPNRVLKVLAHRDIWKNNLMFKFDESAGDEKPLNCVLLDFQTARYLPITIDVLMAIICTTSRSHQDEHFEHYVDFYYKELRKELKRFEIKLDSKLTLENFIKTCEYHKTFALVYNVIVLMITLIPRDFFVNFTEDEYRDFAEGNRSKFVLDFMSKDKEYETRLVEAVEATVEFIYQLPKETSIIL